MGFYIVGYKKLINDNRQVSIFQNEKQANKLYELNKKHKCAYNVLMYFTGKTSYKVLKASKYGNEVDVFKISVK